jgi:hypothetical protein
MSLIKQAAIAVILQLTDEEKEQIIASALSRVVVGKTDRADNMVEFRLIVICAGIYWHCRFKVIECQFIGVHGHDFIRVNDKYRLGLAIKKDHDDKKERYWIISTVNGDVVINRICVSHIIAKKIYLSIYLNLKRHGYDVEAVKKDYESRWGKREWR